MATDSILFWQKPPFFQPTEDLRNRYLPSDDIDINTTYITPSAQANNMATDSLAGSSRASDNALAAPSDTADHGQHTDNQFDSWSAQGEVNTTYQQSEFEQLEPDMGYQGSQSVPADPGLDMQGAVPEDESAEEPLMVSMNDELNAEFDKIERELLGSPSSSQTRNRSDSISERLIENVDDPSNEMTHDDNRPDHRDVPEPIPDTDNRSVTQIARSQSIAQFINNELREKSDALQEQFESMEPRKKKTSDDKTADVGSDDFSTCTSSDLADLAYYAALLQNAARRPIRLVEESEVEDLSESGSGDVDVDGGISFR